MKWMTRVIAFICYASSVVLVVYFLFVKYRYALFRYFDMDELAYLYWTAHAARGNLPYRDFLFILPPGYLFFLAPLFFFSTDPIFTFFAARISSFVVFTLLVIVTMFIFFLLRKRWTAIIAGLFLVFLPLPYDKFIEVRPDTIAALFAMAGTFFQILWMERNEKRTRTVLAFLSGFCYGLSVFLLQKTIPHVVVATLIVFMWVNTHKRDKFRTMFPFIFGGCILFSLFFVWAIMTGNFVQVWYSITQLPSEVAQMGKDFPLPPLNYFLWTDIFFGKSGFNVGFLLNGWLWGTGLALAVLRFVTSMLSRKRNTLLPDILLSAICIVEALLFVFVVPFKHAQYLIPIAVFIALYLADGVDFLWMCAKRQLPTLFLFFLFFIGLLPVFLRGYQDTTMVKFTWWNMSNQPDRVQLFTLLRTIPQKEYIFDLVGLSWYHPSPYYASATPFGQFSTYMSRPLPPLVHELVTTDTKYIYQGGYRLHTLRLDDKDYILAHFTPVGDGSLLVRNDTIGEYTQLWNREQK